MYGCFKSVGLNGLDVGLKLLHLVVVCRNIPPEKRVETFVGLNHGPSYS